MHGLRFDRVLAGTALALVLALGPGGVGSASEPDNIASRVPLPEPANLPPPTAADVAPLPSQVPTPESADLPPPTAADIGALAAPARAAAPAPQQQPSIVASEPTRDSKPSGQAVKPVVDPAPVASVPEPAPLPESVNAPLAASSSSAQPAEAAQESKPADVVALDPVREKLRELISGRLDRIFDRKNEREKVIAFYTAREFAPLWVEDGEANTRAKAAIAHLAGVEADGLDPADYPVPEFRPGAEPRALAEAELRLTAAVVTYARHAHSGRVHYSRVSADVHYTHTPPETDEILTRIAEGADTAAVLDSFNPPHKGYKALKAKLAEILNRSGEAPAIRIAQGPVLRISKKRGKPVFMQDPRVPQLRERLGVPGSPDDLTYDQALADAVARFQREKGLSPNGQLNSATVDALNGRRRDREADIIRANLERWRWLPRDLGKAYVMLNIPDYTLKVVKDGATIWTTRVVVGKPSTPTPILTETMKYITVNPTWNVPPSIVYNEYLPALQEDPTVLERMGLRVSQRPDGSIHISQPPGDRNALGRIRFNFPNKFLVYQHDTPDKHLFSHEKRAYSHGCMRVQDPLKYAEVLLSLVMPNEGYTQERLRKMFGPSEINIQLPVHIPVHITYQTAFVDDAGKLQFRDDIYGRDARVLAALKDERRVADIPVHRPNPSYSRPPARLPAGVAYDGYRPRQPSFFEMLFGGGGPLEPPAPVRRRTSAR